jgi:hypothetical protein
MNPYQILGVTKGCSREELKDAFRAKAWQTHPDRGGDELPFIQVCTAYDLLLKELDRAPRADLADSDPVPVSTGGPWSGPAEPGGPEDAERAGRSDQRPRADRPADPDWEPELIILDAAARPTGPPRPPAPDWEPDLVMLDDPAPEDDPAIEGSQDMPTECYRSWLELVSTRSPRGPVTERSRWVFSPGAFILLAVLVANLWLCWIAWTQDTKDPEAPADPASWKAK